MLAVLGWIYLIGTIPAFVVGWVFEQDQYALGSSLMDEPAPFTSGVSGYNAGIERAADLVDEIIALKG